MGEKVALLKVTSQPGNSKFSRRRVMTAAAASVAAASAAGSVLAQTTGGTPNLRFSNPETLAKPPGGYSHVVEVLAPGRTVYFAGQLGLDRAGKMAGEAGDFRAQATQAFENVKAALASVGGRMEHIVKITCYLVDPSHFSIFRELRATYMNAAAPPASTAVYVVRLARDGALFELDATAVLPPA
jgi:enamine deaminase RidA (YjgF/YER057c/UK114 family)